MTLLNSKTVDINDVETNDLTAVNRNTRNTISFDTSEDDPDEAIVNKESWVKLKRAMAILTSIAHVFLIGITLYVVSMCYLSVNENTTLFVWHPALLSIGSFFLMTESILIFSEDNSITRLSSRKRMIQFHWILQTIAITITYCGFIVIVWNKFANNYSHFHTYHGQFGFAAITLATITLIFGAYSKLTKSIQSRFYHTLLGAVTFILGAITMMLGFNTRWYLTNAYGKRSVQYFCIVLILFIIVVVLTKPIITATRRFKFMLMK